MHSELTLITKKAVIQIDLTNQKVKSASELVALEKPIDAYVNNQYYVTFLASPTMEKELVVGHMLSEGLVRSIEDLKEARVSKDIVRVSLRDGVRLQPKLVKGVGLFTSTQGSYNDFSKTLEETSRPLVSSDLKIKAENILRMIKQLERKSEVYKATRAVHSAALFLENGKLVSFSEDISRHNAVDKVIGDAALKQQNFF